jgi:hypothetical protein
VMPGVLEHVSRVLRPHRCTVCTHGPKHIGASPVSKIETRSHSMVG